MPTDLALRPAGAGDADEVSALYLAVRRAAVPAMPPQIHTDAEVREHVGHEIAGKEVWLATDPDGGDVLGFLVLTPAWLDSLYVGPDHQGRGIGSALLDLAKAQRPDGFSLWVFASNAPARGFYHRHGLLELEHTDGSANEERAPDVRMAWPGERPVAFLRSQIDEVDDDLALLLARRSALTAVVQAFKGTPGQRGRDADREREIAERMARHAPGLGAEAVARIMHVVIGESLDAYEAGSGR
ncbi:MAG TPA: GNAT family N-acetyltransferase [Marmoricola sp.]|jgi:chorismate mutase/GNAT superfamily N-acetyltransferase|nr:GNAT family N-acetyltransferase [Marmoricola sp.]